MLMSNDIRRGSSRFIAALGKSVPMSGCSYIMSFLNIMPRHALGIWTTDRFGVAQYSSNVGLLSASAVNSSFVTCLLRRLERSPR